MLCPLCCSLCPRCHFVGTAVGLTIATRAGQGGPAAGWSCFIFAREFGLWESGSSRNSTLGKSCLSPGVGWGHGHGSRTEDPPHIPPQGLLTSSLQPLRWVLPISQIKKPRPRGVKQLLKTHTASRMGTWNPSRCSHSLGLHQDRATVSAVFSLIPTKPGKEPFFFLFYSREKQRLTCEFPKDTISVCMTPKPSSFLLAKPQCRKEPHPWLGF